MTVARIATDDPGAKGVVRLRVSLKAVKPTAWRRIVVPGSITLADLHVVIQAVMGWDDHHLWSFHLYGVDYGPETGRNPRVPLSQFRLRESERFSYVYDFGDWWEHDVRIEPVKPGDARGGIPRCVAGRGTCPPEDCGGPAGYANAVTEALDPLDDDFEVMADFADELVDSHRSGDFSRLTGSDRLDDLDRTVRRVRRRLRLFEPFDKEAANKRIGGEQGTTEEYL